MQGAVTRDATYLANGTPVGPRDILQARQYDCSLAAQQSTGPI